MTRQIRHPRKRIFVSLAGSFFLSGQALPVLAQDEAPDPAAVARALNSMTVMPLRVEMLAQDTTEVVRVHNSSKLPLAVQSRLFSWAQEAGTDKFAPSADLLVTPSIVSIPPGQTQILRVVRKNPVGMAEKQYKLIIDQLPDPKQAQAGAAATRIRFAIPVFVDRDKAAPPRFDWHLTNDQLQLRNTGGATARVVQITVTSADGRAVPVDQNALRYVFAANAISWPVGKGCSFGKVRISAEIDGETVDAEPTTSCG